MSTLFADVTKSKRISSHLRSCESSKKLFLKLLLIEKPGMREAECRKPHQYSYEVFKIKLDETMRETHMTSFELFEILNLIYFIYFNII